MDSTNYHLTNNKMYDYQTERPKLFTEEGRELFAKVRKQADTMFSLVKYADMGDITKGASGDSWTIMACVDRLVELGEVREVPTIPNTPGQYRVFKRPNQ